MNTKIRALVWEEWRQTRFAFLALLPITAANAALTLATYLPASLAREPETATVAAAEFTRRNVISIHREDSVFLADCFLVTMLSLAFLLLLLYYDRRMSLQFGMPRRLFRLPVRLGTLAIVSYVWRTGAAALLSVAALLVHHLFFTGETLFRLSWALPFFAGGYPLLLAAVTLIAAYAQRRPEILAFLTMLAAGAAGPWLARLAQAEPLPFLAVCLLLSAVIYRHALALCRRGGVSLRGARGKASGRTRLAQLRRHQSALQAQAHLEWRRFGRVLPAVAVVGWAISTGAVIAQGGKLAPQGLVPWLGVTSVLPMAAAAGVLALVLQYSNYRSRTSPVGRYVALRPVDAWVLARARFQMAAGAILLTQVLLFCVGTLTWLYLRGLILQGDYVPNAPVQLWMHAGWLTPVDVEMTGAQLIGAAALLWLIVSLLLWAILFGVNIYSVAGMLLVPFLVTGYSEEAIAVFVAGALTAIATQINTIWLGIARPRLLAVSIPPLAICVVLWLSLFKDGYSERLQALRENLFIDVWFVTLPLVLISLAAVPAALHRLRSGSWLAPRLEWPQSRRETLRRQLLLLAGVVLAVAAVHLAFRFLLARAVTDLEAKAISAGQYLPGDRWDDAVAELPADTAPFMARAKELAQLITTVQDPAARPFPLLPHPHYRLIEQTEPVRDEVLSGLLNVSGSAGLRVPIADAGRASVSSLRVTAQGWHEWVWSAPFDNERRALGVLADWSLAQARYAAITGDSARALQALEVAWRVIDAAASHPSLVLQAAVDDWTHLSFRETQQVLSRVPAESALYRRLLQRASRPHHEQARSLAQAALYTYAYDRMQSEIHVYRPGGFNEPATGSRLWPDWTAERLREERNAILANLVRDTLYHRTGLEALDRAGLLTRMLHAASPADRRLQPLFSGSPRALFPLSGGIPVGADPAYLVNVFAVPEQAGLHYRTDTRARPTYGAVQRDLVAVGLALLAYRDDFGALPAELPALVPEFLPKLPADPFVPAHAQTDLPTVEPAEETTPLRAQGRRFESAPRKQKAYTFHYMPTPDGGFEVFSVGGNARAERRLQERVGAGPYRSDDIIFRIEAQP